MRLTGLVISFLVVLGISVHASEVRHQKATEYALKGKSATRLKLELDEIWTVFFDDFENGNQWIAQDFTSSPAMWHTNSNFAFENGVSWWCGQNSLNGYDNGWLQYLETPPLNFSDAGDQLFLEFNLNFGSETGNPANPDYDGWDGSTVFYSIDNEENWQVLDNPSFAYNAESLYAFGYTHGLGAGISGWRGVSGGWQYCNYSLSNFVGENEVKFRFAFASDSGTNTGANPDWIGFLVDNIIISDGSTVFLENDAENTSYPLDLIPLEQQGSEGYFVLQEDEAHSQTSAWACDDAYSVSSVLISPEIVIPENAETFLEYFVWCDFPDDDGDGDSFLDDYYSIEISTDGQLWSYLGHDFGFGANLYGWVLRDYMYVQTDTGTRIDDINLSDYAGETIQIRFRVYTDDNNDGGNGNGLFIDDIHVYADSGIDFDLGIDDVYIPFPTTLNMLNEGYATIRNFGNYTENVSADWYLNGELQLPRFCENEDIEAESGIIRYFDHNPEDNENGWVPQDVGWFELYTAVESQDDENPHNDTSAVYTFEVLDEGFCEYGYDDRNPVWTTSRFLPGQGPATLFDFVEDETIENYTLDEIRVLWNHDFIFESYDLNLHVYNWTNESTGQELINLPVTVDSFQTYPVWQIIDVSSENLVLTEAFLVWFEILDESPARLPHITYSERKYGVNHHFSLIDGDLVDSGTDWFIRCTGQPQFNSVEEQKHQFITDFRISNIYPNPFNSSFRVSLNLPTNNSIKVCLFDLLGREILLSGNRHFSGGQHSLMFSADGLSSGVYFLQVSTESGISATKRVVLVR